MFLNNHINNHFNNHINNHFRCQFHKSVQSLKLAYSRTTIIFLCINFIKFERWRNWMKKNYKSTYDKFNKITKEVNNLTLIKKKRKHLVPHINYDQKKIMNIIYQKIINDKLKFKQKHEKWTEVENLSLLQYICNQSKCWILTNKTLHKMWLYFEKRYTKDFLRRKCYKYGIDYCFC